MSLRNIVAAIRRRRREPPRSTPAEAQADLIEVFKGERRMELKREGTGCVAVTDAEIREVWSLVPTGARVVIHP